MYISSPDDIAKINCGFIFSDGSYYGTDDYRQGNRTHDQVLDHFGIKETPGCIRFCSSFIMLESAKHLKVEISPEYIVSCITKEQSRVLRKWISSRLGKITCPHTKSKTYQFRYLESLDDQMLSNIIML